MTRLRQDEKRRNAAAGQRPIVDLHHVQQEPVSASTLIIPKSQNRKQYDAAEAPRQLRKVGALRRS